MDHLAGCRCIIPGVLCDREWDQEEIVKNIVEKYQRGRERHCVGIYNEPKIREKRQGGDSVLGCWSYLYAYLCEKEILKALLYFLQKRYNKHNKQRKYDRQCRAGSDGEHIVNVSR